MNETAIFLFDYLHHMSESPEGKVIYILSIICLLMIVDFLTGTVAAWRNPEIKFLSQEGINGTLRDGWTWNVRVCYGGWYTQKLHDGSEEK